MPEHESLPGPWGWILAVVAGVGIGVASVIKAVAWAFSKRSEARIAEAKAKIAERSTTLDEVWKLVRRTDREIKEVNRREEECRERLSALEDNQVTLQNGILDAQIKVEESKKEFVEMMKLWTTGLPMIAEIHATVLTLQAKLLAEKKSE